MSDRVAPTDPLAEAAALIRDVGLGAERARRYRALATSLAEHMLDRSLELGSIVRRAGRDAGPAGDVIRAAIDELRSLQARCDAAIADVQASAAYREVAAAFAAGDVPRAAAHAVDVFADVERGDAPETVVWEVPVGGERGGEHFIAPAECAARIEAVRRNGLRAASAAANLGGDETITPIALSADVTGIESPVALAYEPRALPGPLCRIAGGALLIFYAECLRAPFSVHCAGTVTDEWWAIRPDAYVEWRTALEALLRTQGLVVTTTP